MVKCQNQITVDELQPLHCRDRATYHVSHWGHTHFVSIYYYLSFTFYIILCRNKNQTDIETED